jgi:DNA-binding NarL/FixJ family response regulator
VCAEAVNGRHAVAMVRELRPDVLLLDLSMPELGGLDALRALAAGDRRTAVLLLTGDIDDQELVAAIQLGARGVLMKDSPTALLIKAVRSVATGEYWVSREEVPNLVETLRLRVPHDSAASQAHHLTSRELLVVSGVVAAFSNREIAEALRISEKTVKQHLTNVFDKVGVSSRVELAMAALRRHLHLPHFPPVD